MKMDKKIIIANWKMNPNSLKEAKTIFNDIKVVASKLQSIQTVICPPFLYLNELTKSYKGHRIKFGAQNIFWEEKGSYTGEISPIMLKNLKTEYVIIGHSERRSLGETDSDINKKIKIALKNDLKVVLCIGEKERDEEGVYLEFLENQIKNALNRVPKESLGKILIAYEPIWAIGAESKETATPLDVYEIVILVRKILSKIYNREVASKIQVLYGGSVNFKNAKELVESGNVEGLLVGRESLNPEKFNKLLKAVSE
jgi:triosephosphate isomerase